MVEAGVGGQPRANPGRELGVRVQAGADGGASERDLPKPLERRLDPRLAFADLGGVPGELLPERHRDGVHPMGASRLDDVVELGRLRRERGRKLGQCRQQVVTV